VLTLLQFPPILLGGFALACAQALSHHDERKFLADFNDLPGPNPSESASFRAKSEEDLVAELKPIGMPAGAYLALALCCALALLALSTLNILESLRAWRLWRPALALLTLCFGVGGALVSSGCACCGIVL